MLPIIILPQVVTPHFPFEDMAYLYPIYIISAAMVAAKLIFGLIFWFESKLIIP